jgi:predicted RND superfamily exporter protein
MLDNNKIKKFVELIKGEEVTKVVRIHKDVVTYKVPKDKRKNIKENLHSLCVEALTRMSKDNQIFISINDAKVNVKLEDKNVEDEFINAKFSAEDWITNIILLSLAKL